MNSWTRVTPVRIGIVVILVVGLVLSLIGALGYHALTQMSYPAPTAKFGLVIFTSPSTRISNNGRVETKIYDIDTDTNTARLNVVCSFDTKDDTSKLIFGMQSPYNFSSLNVHVDMQSKSTGQGRGGGLGNLFFLGQFQSEDRKNGLFYFWVIINRYDPLFNLFDEFSFNVTMNLTELLYRKSYTTFGLIAQFDTGFPAVPADGLPHETAIGTFSFFTPVSSSYALEVAQPEHSRMESTPGADAIIFAGGQAWYLWSLPQKRSTIDYFGMAVLTDFEMLDLVERRETSVFQDGLFLGVGLPALMTGGLELLRELKKEGQQKATELPSKNDGRQSTSGGHAKRTRH